MSLDGKSIGKVKIELLECQVDLILRSLEFFSYSYKFMIPRYGKALSNEENLRVCLIRDTYEQIASEFGLHRLESADGSKGNGGDEKFFEKIA